MRILLFASAVMLLLAAYIVSPYVALHRIDDALQRRDTVALEGYADWPTLREQLRSDFKGLMADVLSSHSLCLFA